MPMPRRYKYNMAHGTVNQGDFYNMTPFLRMEVAPGDTWNGRCGVLTRLSPLKRAWLVDVLVDLYMFYIPHRLVWNEWEDFLAQGPNAAAPIVTPTFAGAAPHLWYPGAIGNYSQLPLRAYNLVFNEYFRDQEDVVVSQTNTAVLPAAALRRFQTTFREFVEVGNEATADVQTGTPDFTNATDILRAIAEQKLQMRRETYGSRYIDILRSYGVGVNYQMLQRPEVVAHTRKALSVTDVVSTSDTTTANLGELAGHGIAGVNMRLKRKSFPEHGTLLGICVLRPEVFDEEVLDYFDRPREYKDYFDPGLVYLPPEGISHADLQHNPGAADPNEIIGYHKWGEWYRHATNRVHENMAEWVPEYLSTIQGNTLSWKNWMYGTGATNYDSLFNDVTYGQYQLQSSNGLSALRMIPRDANLSGVKS